jgi:hypothetical protein
VVSNSRVNTANNERYEDSLTLKQPNGHRPFSLKSHSYPYDSPNHPGCKSSSHLHFRIDKYPGHRLGNEIFAITVFPTILALSDKRGFLLSFERRKSYAKRGLRMVLANRITCPIQTVHSAFHDLQLLRQLTSRAGRTGSLRLTGPKEM